MLEGELRMGIQTAGSCFLMPNVHFLVNIAINIMPFSFTHGWSYFSMLIRSVIFLVSIRLISVIRHLFPLNMASHFIVYTSYLY